jgi:hypothetical protein
MGRIDRPVLMLDTQRRLQLADVGGKLGGELAQPRILASSRASRPVRSVLNA